jgi:tetratricopeptide (TPR) repeat protein
MRATSFIRYFALLIVGATVAAMPARAGDDGARTAIAEIGLAFEAAGALPESERTAALADLRGRIESALDDGVDKGHRAAARLLAAEVAYAMEDFVRAAEWFEEAAGDAKKTPYADDAAAGRIRALEALGNDAEAAEKWDEWMERYGEGPFAAETAVARVWNCIRRDSLADAHELLTRAVSESPWLVDDPRLALATSTLAFLEGRWDDVAVTPSGSPVDDAALYLSALALDSRDEPLKAAARFQELVER